MTDEMLKKRPEEVEDAVTETFPNPPQSGKRVGKKTRSISDLWGNIRRQWHPTPVLLPGKFHGRRSLVAAVHGITESRTRLSEFTITFHCHALEKEMAPHSSVLAWRIPGMAGPGGLPPMGSHRVGHD